MQNFPNWIILIEIMKWWIRMKCRKATRSSRKYKQDTKLLSIAIIERKPKLRWCDFSRKKNVPRECSQNSNAAPRSFVVPGSAVSWQTVGNGSWPADVKRKIGAGVAIQRGVVWEPERYRTVIRRVFRFSSRIPVMSQVLDNAIPKNNEAQIIGESLIYRQSDLNAYLTW